METNTEDWVLAVRRRGLARALLSVLDALEPMGVLVAQLAYVAQPLARVLGAHEALRQMAEALEHPEQLTELRRRLVAKDDATPPGASA